MDESLQHLFTVLADMSQEVSKNENNIKEHFSTFGSVNSGRTDTALQEMVQEQKLMNQPLVQLLDDAPAQDWMKEVQVINKPKNLSYDLNLIQNYLIAQQKPEEKSLQLKFIQEPQYHDQKDIDGLVLEIQQDPTIFSLLTSKKNTRKNSNAIKKMGRIILNNIDKFEIPGCLNQGIQKMQQLLSNRAQGNQRLKDIRDGFNTSHLKALFCSGPPQVSSHNLKVAKRLFARKLRQQVFKSAQIQEQNKLLYLNTLKGSALRFASKKLAIRLQLSQRK